MNELHLFAGAGGGILGGILLGHTPVCAVEIEPYCRKVLLQRQRDGILPKFPIWDDVTTFDGTPWRGKVDVVCGGFPCQDISIAGGGAGIEGERSGLWSEMARIIGEIRPQYAFVENSPMLALRGLGRVLGDLSEMGYDAKWGVLGAHHCGAPHKRDRIWILSHSERKGLEGYIRESREQKIPESGNGSSLAYPKDKRNVRGNWELGAIKEENLYRGGTINGGRQWWAIEPALGRVAHGVANRVDRLKAIGNGQVPIVAALAFRILGGKLK